ncbi:MAG: SCO2522 family protein [Labedaea sp.]
MSARETAVYSEATEQAPPRQVQLAHLSIEVGHFYMDDLLNGEDRIHAQFSRVIPWIEAAKAGARAEFGDTKARISTCFLTDDYFGGDAKPGDILPKLLRIAEDCGVGIDYIAREAGCHVANGVPLAELTAAMLLPEPPVGTNGSRPPLHETGWLCNGERSMDGDVDQAMQVKVWRPPVEFGKREHSIFVDVELWKDTTERRDGQLAPKRTWSCPFLAAVWHLMRLGMLRFKGEPVAQPQPWPADTDWPETWEEMPAVIQLNQRAAPFSAYRTTSILPHTYVAIENAVHVILNHLDLDQAVINQVISRGLDEGVVVPAQVTRRVSHVFIQEPENPGARGTPDADLG